jgi:outer membrane protein OmpA-like peptidoglycan-associated protein
MVATSANISTNNLAAYDASIEFVAGILVVTPPPPTVTSITQPNGSEAGGEQILIAGTGLSAVTSILFGNVMIPSSGFVVNGDGTEISLVAPPGTGNVSVTLIAGDTQLLLDYSYNPYEALVTDVAPLTGPGAGGNRVVITGTHLEKVTEVRLGATVITAGSLTRSQDGTSISFNALAGTGKKNIVLVATSGSYSFEYTYTGVTVVGDPRLSLKLVNPQFGHRLSDHTVQMSAKDLKPGATYTLTMYSRATTMATSTTSATGSINSSMTIPAKACKTPGLHKLVLSSEDSTGAKHESSVYVVLGKKCEMNAVVQKDKRGSWNISGILFSYQKWDLSPATKATLKALKPWMKNAKSIKVSGYTETDGKGYTLKVLNKILAKKRSQSVISYLKTLGVNARLIVDPVGAKDPVSPMQSKNRRVELSATF